MEIRKLVVCISAVVLLGAAVHVMAQEPAPPPDGQAPAGAPGAPPAQGGRGGRGGGAAGPGRRGGFPQYTRPAASQDVLVRGKSLYDAQCASCHAPDMRGVLEQNGPNLLQSADTMMDKQGETVAAALAKKHNPPINLPDTDSAAISSYIHSIQATMGGQGSPPGRNPVGLTYNILVGDPVAGQAEFAKLCSNCHSVTGDLNGFATKYPDPRTLQDTWVTGGGAGGRGGGRGGGASGQQATVTMADGEKIEGKLVRKDDFLIVLTLADGTRKSIAVNDGLPKVDEKDPQEAHKKMVRLMDDPDDKNMHDITAYLATIK